MANLNEIKTQLESVESLKIYFTDLNGRIMGLPVNPDNIDSILSDGIGFDGSSVAGFATVENSDRFLFPEPESFRLVKFSDETLGFFIGSVYNEKGSRAPADPRALLENVKGLELVEMEKLETCCGFGGTFAAKFHLISAAMTEQKVDNAIKTGADYIVSTEASCLMNMESYIRKQNLPIKTIHLVDILAQN